MDIKPSKRVTYWLTGLSFALIVATRGQAIGIGESQVKSVLNQPLNVSLPIVNIADSGATPGSIEAGLASREDHERAGLQYPSVLQGAEFVLFETADGRHSIIVNTDRPVDEPLLTFLVQVDWSHGRLLKEVSILLDPPGYQRLPEIAPPAATQIASAPYREVQPLAEPKFSNELFQRPTLTELGSIDVPVFVEIDAAMSTYTAPESFVTESVQAAYRAPTSVQLDGNRYGPVRSGDTLMDIATAAAQQSGGNAKAIARSIYQNNPGSFLGSMNRLARGSYLTIPTDISTTTVAAAPSSYLSAPSGIADISTISDFAFDLPAIELDGETTSYSIAAANSAVAIPPRPRLNILPADDDASQLAKELRDKLESDAPASQPAAEAPVIEPGAAETNETPASDTAALPDSNAAETVERSLDNQIAQVQSTQPETEGTATREAATETDNIRAEVEAGNLATVTASDQTDLMATLLKWLPWILLAFAVPAILFMAFRRREDPVTQIPARHESTLDSTPPQRQDTIDVNAERVADIEPAISMEDSEFDSETVIINELSETIQAGPDDEEPLVQTSIHEVLPPPTPAFTPRDADEDVMSSLQMGGTDESFNIDDLTLTDSDTQESIKPNFAEEQAQETVLLQRVDAESNETDEELDSAQEAEIYLAYGQYMLAENNITRLREADPTNDRYKLLALKLFADTGRTDEMRTMADDILSRYPDASSGVNQQVNKVCERAIVPEQPEEAPDEFVTASIDSTQSLSKDIGLEELLTTEPVEESNYDSDSLSALEAELPALPEFEEKDDEDEQVLNLEIEDPALQDHDIAASGLTDAAESIVTEASNTPIRFNDDIEDYLHDHDKVTASLPSLTEDPLLDSLGALELSSDLELEDEPEIEYNELTEDELDAISIELDLIDGSPNTLEIESEFGHQDSEGEVENFTDTDYRLSALGRKAPETEASERLDVPFDLEMELEKLSRSSKSLGGGE